MQVDQVNGTQEKITANKDSSIQINKADEHLVHAEIEATQYNQQTGKKESTPIIQNFYPHEFDLMEQQKAFTGKDVRIVHLPTGYETPSSNASSGQQQTGGSGDGKEKALTAMNKAELQAKYAELWGEAAPADANKEELLTGIKEAIEKNSQQQTGGSGE